MHEPVLLNEVIEGLAIQPDGIYVDATFGRGGHTKAILQQLGEAGRVIGIDRDPEAIAFAAQQLSDEHRLTVSHGSFETLSAIVQAKGIEQVNGILLDLGVSSPQLDEGERGFSFLRDGPLDMRMDPTTGISAETWLAQAKQEEIAEVLHTYGEGALCKTHCKGISNNAK